MHFSVLQVALKVILWNAGRKSIHHILSYLSDKEMHVFLFFVFFLINNICITHLTRAALCKLISKSRFFPASSYQTSCQLYVPTGCVCPVQVAGDKQTRF